MPQRPLLTPQQVSDLLQIKVTTLETWRYKKIGPPWLRLGEGKRAAIRYQPAAIDAYLQEQGEKS